MTKKQNEARARNHLILRLRGAAAVFKAVHHNSNDQSSIKAAIRALRDIDIILSRMGAETEAGRTNRYRRELINAD